MAKDVDLSSKEWRDLVFEGKNKEFGAYTMRQNSDRRHNLSMIALGIIALLLAGGPFLVDSFGGSDDSAIVTENEQLLATMAEEEAEEPEEEVQEKYEEPEVEEVTPEELLNTMKVTEINITADEEVKEEIVSQDEQKESETAIGQTNFDQGTDNLDVVREHKDEVVVEEKKPEPKVDEIFKAVEQMPQYPGGEAALMADISKNIRYPAMAAENNIQGRVVVQFVVEKNGSVGQVKVVRGKDPDLDKEAMRVCKTLKKFIPGKMNGESVRVWYTLPINFKLQTQ